MSVVKSERVTDSGIEIEPVYRADTDREPEPDPGEFPYTRGIYPTMYRGRRWTMRQYAGFSSVAESNARYRLLLERGTTGLSIAFDLPTQLGLDSDDPRALGEVGRVGVPISTVDDMRRLFAGIDQGAVFPWFGCRTRACSFHGQPSKGNVYQRFNFRQIDTLFMYGPLMRDYYLRNKAANPQWPDITLLEVGQPLTDRRCGLRMDRREARRRLGLDCDRFTVIYAPSFEYCSSLATAGPGIVDALLALDVNLIVKPHPAFYNAAPFDDEFNRDSPRALTWRDAIDRWNARGRCLFPATDTLDGDVALAAADVMLTDYSGIAFDGITLDLGMIYWDCPRFYDEYLPRRYGADGAAAKADLACNVGRDCGLTVADTAALVRAVESYRTEPTRLAGARRQIRQQLYFNLGRAADAMADAIENLLFGVRHDRQRTEHRLLG